jgi:hypothetical protein
MKVLILKWPALADHFILTITKFALNLQFYSLQLPITINYRSVTY